MWIILIIFTVVLLLVATSDAEYEGFSATTAATAAATTAAATTAAATTAAATTAATTAAATTAAATTAARTAATGTTPARTAATGTTPARTAATGTAATTTAATTATASGNMLTNGVWTIVNANTGMAVQFSAPGTVAPASLTQANTQKWRLTQHSGDASWYISPYTDTTRRLGYGVKQGFSVLPASNAVRQKCTLTPVTYNGKASFMISILGRYMKTGLNASTLKPTLSYSRLAYVSDSSYWILTKVPTAP